MGFDATIKRYYPLLLCLLIGIAAYFQASGMGQLVSSSVALDPSALPAAPPPHRSGSTPVLAGTEHAQSAGPILARNPFDSVTGPLDGKPIDVTEPLPVPANTDPYADPDCDVAKVLLITASEDPEWSFAAIASSDGKSMLRRQGDDVSGHLVHYIGWDRVWLTTGSARCQMKVGGKTVVAAAKPPPGPDVSGGSTRNRGRKVPPEIASKIHKISDTQFDIEGSVVDTILENQSEFMKSARIVPEKEGDKVVGIRLFGIRPDSLLGMLGLENGDRLQTINGFEMTDPQKALEAYARLRSADHLTVTVNRRGKPMNVDYNLKR